MTDALPIARVIDVIPLPAFVVDLSNYHVCYANAPLAEFVGQPLDALIDRPITFVPASTGERAELFHRLAQSPSEPVRVQAVESDNRLCEVRVSAESVGEERLLVILEEISSLERLRSELDGFRFIVESSPEMVCILDRGGGIVYANATHEEVLGKTVNELVGSSIFDHFHPADLGELWRLFTELRPETPRRAMLRLLAKDGAITHVETLAAQPGQSSEGASRHIVFLAQDASRQRKLQMALSESQKMEGIGRLARGIAHDFNNLLQLIIGAVQCLDREDGVPTHLVRWHNTIRSAAERGRNLVGQLQAFSKRDVGVRLPHNLGQLVRELNELIRPMVIGSCELEIQEKRGDVVVEVDMGQVLQVLVNLVINAFEAFDDRRGRLEIITSLVHRNGHAYACIALRDNAGGIPAEHIEQVFEPFFTTKSNKKGTGLGLAVAYGIIEAHGGRIELDSELGRGSEFRVLLPRASEGTQAVEITPQPLDGDDDAMVLVVDDEPMQRTILRKQLEALGYAVLTAEDGARAVDLFSDYQDEIDCIVLDLVMPRMDGGEALRAIRELDADIPVILTSGSRGDSTLTELLDEVYDVLPKPFSIEQLRTVLRSALRYARASQRPSDS